MPNREELEEAIEQLKLLPANFETCQKLVVYTQLLNTYYGKAEEKQENNMTADLMALLDEIMECLQVINPQLYESVKIKIASIKGNR